MIVLRANRVASVFLARSGRWLVPVAFGGLLVASCGEEESPSGNESTAGSAGSMTMAGAAGSSSLAGGGMGGSSRAGAAGSAGMGMGGSAMASGGSAGAAGGGMAGSGMLASGGGTGVLRVLNDNQSDLLVPTTAAIVGDRVWVAIGQLSELFAEEPQPSPFRIVGIPIEGGEVEEDIDLPGAPFFPEGVAASAAGELYVGSIALGIIARVPPQSTQAGPFMDAAVSQRGVIGMTVDDQRQMLWFCDSNPDPNANLPGGALVGISLPGADELVRHELPDYVVPQGDVAAEGDAGIAPSVQDASAGEPLPAFCNDVIALPSGDLLLTDSRGRIFRIASDDVLTENSAEVWLEVPELAPEEPSGFGVNGLALVGGSLIVANGSLIQIDPNSDDPASTLRVLALSEGGAAAELCGPDGLAVVPDSDNELIVVENGLCAAARSRVVRVRLDLD